MTENFLHQRPLTLEHDQKFTNLHQQTLTFEHDQKIYYKVSLYFWFLMKNH